MGPPMLPHPVTPRPPASTAWRLVLAAVLLFFCFWVALPVFGGAALLVALAAVGLVSDSLAHVGGYDAGVFAVGLRVGLFGLIPGALILAHRAAYGAHKQGFRRWIPTTFDFGELVLAAGGLLFLAWLTAKLEWDGNPWLPDELATSTGLACLVAFGVGGPVALLVGALALHVGVYEWAVRSANRARGVAIAVGVAAGSLMLLGSLGSQARTSARTASWSPQGLNADDLRRAGNADSFTETSRYLLHAMVAAPSGPASPPPSTSPAPALPTAPAPTVPMLPTPQPLPSATPALPSLADEEAADRLVADCLRDFHKVADSEAEALRKQRRIQIEDARDLAYDALLQVCESNAISAYVDVGAVIRIAARNRANSNWRRQKRVACGVAVDDFPCPAWREPTMVRLELEQAGVTQIICRMDPRARATIEEHLHDRSFAEIGATLGMTADQARDTYNNALKKIRRELKQKCFTRPGISP